METIQGNIDIEGIKRFHIDGAIVKVKCPTCGVELTSDFRNDYLYYPEIGKADTISFYCEDCDDNDRGCYEFTVPMKVLSAIVTIEYDLEKILPQ